MCVSLRKGLEQFFYLLRINANARVLNGEDKPVTVDLAHALHAEIYSPIPGELKGIAQQVQQHLAQPMNGTVPNLQYGLG